MHAPKHPHHHIRYYIVMFTMIVGGIFILLLMNNEGNGFDITSAVIGDSENKTMFNNIEAKSQRQVPEDYQRKKKIDDQKDIALTLKFNKVPDFKKEAKVNKMELHFDDLTTTITVNQDRLELNNLKEVKLTIEGFQGTIDFTGIGFSTKGKARRLAINDVALSSDEEIELSFNNLDFNYLNIDDIELKEIELIKGDGALDVGEKLHYSLKQEEVYINSFKGEFTVDKNNESILALKGISNGISTSGESLYLELG